MYKYVQVCTSMYMYVCMYGWMDVCTSMCTSMYVCMYVYIYIHVNNYAYIYTYIYIHSIHINTYKHIYKTSSAVQANEVAFAKKKFCRFQRELAKIIFALGACEKKECSFLIWPWVKPW